MIKAIIMENINFLGLKVRVLSFFLDCFFIDLIYFYHLNKLSVLNQNALILKYYKLINIMIIDLSQ